MERADELNRDQQMKFAFMNEGGFLDGQPHVFNEGGVLADDGMDKDPVSGNEVPSGSMAKEVRDDVPAMLSEGEYVVPADVVRYHGIDKFEELREEAKMGLSRMEADGRIGGEPVDEDPFPFSVEELEGFQEGGAVGDTYSDVMGDTFTPGQRYPSSPRFPGVGFELRNFTNPKTGRVVVIPFFNGMPMQYIPPDFLEGGQTSGTGTFDPAADERSRQEDEAERARRRGTQGRTDEFIKDYIKTQQGQSQQATSKPFSEYSPDDFRSYLKTRQSVVGRVLDQIPIVGIITSMQDNAAREFARKSLIQGKNIVTGEALTNNEAGVLMEVADMPRGKSMLETIDNFLQGKTPRADGIVIDDTPPIDTELRRTTYEPEKPLPETKDITTPESFQNIIDPNQTFEVPDPNIDAQLNEKIEKERATGPVGMPLEDAQAQFETIDAPKQKEYLWVTFPGNNKPVRVEKSEALKLGEAALANIDKDVDIPGVAKVSTTGDNRRKIVSGAVLDKFITSSGLKVAPVEQTKEALQENIKSGPINKDTGLVNKIQSIFDFSATGQDMAGRKVLIDKSDPKYVSLTEREKQIVENFNVTGFEGNYMAALAKAKIESGENYNQFRENLYYSTPDRFKLVFGNNIAPDGRLIKNISNQEINNFGIIKNPQAMAEFVYGSNTSKGKELGNTEVGDAYKYRGSSTLHITGKANFEELGLKLFGDKNYFTKMSESEITNYFSDPFRSDQAAAKFLEGKNVKTARAMNTVIGGFEKIPGEVEDLKKFVPPTEPRVAVAEQPLPVTTGEMLTEPVLPDVTAFKPQPQPEMTPEQFRAVEQQRAMMQGMRQPSDPTQVGAAPLAPTIDTPGGFEVPTVGVDAAPSALPVEPGPLQDLPVGVSIEADGQFTGTGALPPTPDFTTFEQDRTISAPTDPRPKRRVQRKTPTTTGLLDVSQTTPTSSVSRRDSRVPEPKSFQNIIDPKQTFEAPEIKSKPLETEQTGVFRLFPEYEIAKNQARIRTENKRISGVGQQIEDAFDFKSDINTLPKIDSKDLAPSFDSTTPLPSLSVTDVGQKTEMQDKLESSIRVQAEQDRQRALEQEKFRREQNRLAEQQKRRNIEIANKFKTSQEVNTQLQKELADAQNQSNKLLDNIKKKDEELAAAKERKFREQQEKEIYDETQKNVQEQMAAAAKEQEATAKKKSEDRKSAYIQHLKDVGNVEGGPGGDAMVQIERQRQEQAKQDERDRKNPWVDSASSAMLDRQGEIVYSMGNAEDIEKHEQRVRDQAEAAARHDAMLRREEEQNRDSGDDGGGPPDITDSGGGGGSDKIVCTEMYRQTQLVDWKKAMKIWDVYQRRYLTPEHQIGYHWLFKPYIKGMQRSGVLTKLGAALAKRRTQHLKHILTKGKAKDDLVGNLWCKIIHPIVYVAGKVKTFCNA
jgi:predicted chitinase